MCFQVALWYVLTYRLQNQFGYSPLQAGLAFLPLTVSMMAVNLWLTPRLMNQHPPRLLIVAGALITVPGLAWLAVVGSGSFASVVLAPTVVIGVGGGLMNTPLATLVTTGIRSEHAGAASGLMNTAKQFGGVLGLAGATTVSALAGTDRAAFAFMAVAVLAVIAVTSAMSPARTRRDTPFH